jgi:glycosyltransferase involved in cell wall biosynthesis
MSQSKRSRVVLLGPSRKAVSGVSTHLNQLFSSGLARAFELLHFQIGSEGINESPGGKLWRLVTGPVAFLFYLRRNQPQIVQLNTSLDPKSYWRDIAFLLVAKTLGRRVVYQVHGGALPEDFFAGSRWLTALLRWVLSMPDVVVLLAQVELQAYRRFVPDQRLEVIPNAIEAEVLAQRLLNAEVKGPLHLVYLGRMAETKGVFEAVEALARLVGGGRDLHLTFAGGGPDEERLRDRVRALGLAERVRFVGPLFGADKDALWRSADVFVFPTYHWEGLPYALLEAMAAGAVPVTTGVGAIPDVIQDDTHGLFVPPRDVEALAQALARLDGDRALLLKLARAGRARVLEHYSVARLAAGFARLYESLTGKATCAASRAM